MLEEKDLLVGELFTVAENIIHFPQYMFTNRKKEDRQIIHSLSLKTGHLLPVCKK